MESTKRIWTHTIADLRFAWREFVATDVLYKILALVLLLPTLGLAQHGLLLLSGSEFQADQDILFFFLSPLGLATLLLIAGGIIAITALELACLMVIGQAAADGRRISVIAALRFALAHGLRVLRLTTHLVGRLLLLSLPFLAVAGAIAWWLLTEHDINYYLSHRPPNFLLAAAGIGLSLAAMSALLIHRMVCWAYVMPLVLFENSSPNASFGLSSARTAGHRSRLAMLLASWLAASLAVSAAILGLVRILGLGLSSLFENQLSLLLPAMAGVLVLWFAATVIASLAFTCLYSVLTVNAYRRLGDGKPLPGAGIENPSPPPARDFIASRPLQVLFAASAIAATVSGLAMLDRAGADHAVYVIAHRGAAGSAPENTLASIEEAIRQGTDFVEIDVQENRDGTVVVIHDSDLMKVAGVATKVWDLSDQDLVDIDIGSWYAPEFGEQRVPTLQQVLDLARGKVKVNIELKYYGHEEQLEQRVVEAVEAANMAEDVVVMSLKHSGVEALKNLRPDWTTGLLTARALGDLRNVDVDFLAVNAGMATRRFTRDAQAAGKQVYVWTLNEPADISRLVSRGIDGVITDHPGLARQILEQRASRGSVERLLMDLALMIGANPEPVDEQRELQGTYQAAHNR